jgi:dephospho-CoA kinase
MLIIGLTGGIGSGKTAVSNIFREVGAPVIDADEIGRHLSMKGQSGYQAIVNEFGNQIIANNGELNRDKLRDTVFNNNDARKKLESLLHPLIRNEIAQEIKQLKDSSYCIIVVPLLLETDYRDIVDRILVVDSTEENQIARVMLRDNLDRNKITQIMKAQLSRNERLQQADDIVVNDGNLTHLKKEVVAMHQRYLLMAGATEGNTSL